MKQQALPHKRLERMKETGTCGARKTGSRIIHLGKAPLLLSVATVLLSISAPGLNAQPSQDPARLLQALEELAAKRSKQKEEGLSAVIQSLQKDAATGPSSVSAFSEAYRTVELAGKSGQGREWQDWKTSNRDLLASPLLRLAAQLHLQYLALSLRRSNSDNAENFVEPSLDYLKALQQFAKERHSSGNSNRFVAELMDRDLHQGLIARERNLSPFFANLKDWEWVPGNAEGILEKNVRPFLREKKDPRVVETWDWQIALEEIPHSANNRTHQSETFRSRRIPELRLRQAEERARLGQTPIAVRDALAILTAFPDHPDFDKWVENAKGWLLAEIEQKQTPANPSESSPEPPQATPPAVDP